MKRLPAAAQLRVAIAQDFDSTLFERAGHLFGANAKIMVAEDRESSMPRLDAAENFRNGLDVRARISDKIAGKGDEIGLKLIHHLHGLTKHVFGKKHAVVDVGELND